MRLAVVGLGNQGRKRCAVAGGDIVAKVDLFKPDAQYRRIEDVPRDAYDGAMVCTSEDAKLGIIEYLLGIGKHILVEKPLLVDQDDAARLQLLVDQAGTVCYTAYNHRFEPHIARVKNLLTAGDLGEIYLARLFYGNGTARDVRQSVWRDQGMGVLADLGSHLLDIIHFFFGAQAEFVAWSFNRFENEAYDHIAFGSRGRPVIEAEASLISWRNDFRLDIYASGGSAHIDGLCKWGPSTFTIRKRRLPSGKPDEERYVLECDDPTWTLEYQYFEDLCLKGGTSFDKDHWVSGMLHGLADDAQARSSRV